MRGILFSNKNYQPISRILCCRRQWPSFILLQHYCYNLAAYPPTQFFRTLNEPFYGAGVHGITAHKVYPRYTLLHKAVSSYLTFSPLPFPRK